MHPPIEPRSSSDRAVGDDAGHEVDRDARAVAAHLARLDARPGPRGAASARKERGAHYTPPALVEWLLEVGFLWKAKGRTRVLDPACGAGHFLVAAARRIAANTTKAMPEILEKSIHGVDLDADAVAIARERLLALLPERTAPATRRRVARTLARNVVVGDSLATPAPLILAEHGAEVALRPGGFDLVVGNPPFLNQLEKATAADRARAAALRDRTRGAFARYADLSGVFLYDALLALSNDGCAAFVMPQSFLAAADSRALRDALARFGRLRAIWSCHERLFDDAQVSVCAVAIDTRDLRVAPERSLVRAFGADFRALPARALASPEGAESWSYLLADALGAPASAQGGGDMEGGGGVVASPVDRAPTLATIADATADFRDQFYGLKGAIVDRAMGHPTGEPKLVTTRHVDLARCAWGGCDARILHQTYRHPRADRARLDAVGGMARWAEARLVPKVLVATQTRVVEAVVDADGAWLPVVPLLTVTLRAAPGVAPDADEAGDALARALASEDGLWMLAAAIASPVVVARAVARYFGSAMSSHAIKLSAKQLLAMPCPTDLDAWLESATIFRKAQECADDAERRTILDRYAEASCRAHRLAGADLDETLAFWRARFGA
ncbi:MAG: hypothetical protein RI967_1477 [Planctomycetota bacterium]